MDKRFAVLFEALTAITAVSTLAIGILAAIFFGFTEAAAVFVVGWLLLVPVFGILSTAVTGPGAPAIVEQRLDATEREGEMDDADESSDGRNPLELLRERYARGDIDEVEFEERLGRLVATEEIPPSALSDSEPIGDADLEVEPETLGDAEIEREE